jgi:tetratricopeptide (TPR) repeat protein
MPAMQTIANSIMRARRQADVTQNINTAIDQAIACLNAGAVGDALARLRAFNAKHETSPVRSNLIGLIYLSAKNSLDALDWFEQAVRLDPAYPEALSNRGVTLQELGRGADALACYEAALRLGLADPTLFYNRGNLLREAGRLEEAIASFDMALKLNPAYVEAFRVGGMILRDLGRPQAALEFFDEAIRLQPTFVDALLDRGNLLQDLDRSEEAIACYDAALAKEPGHAGLLNNRGSALHAIGRLQEALADFDTALQLNSHFPQAWFNRGSLLLTLERPEAALVSYDRALSLRPLHVETLCGRAIALKQLGRRDDALASFEAALREDPTSAHVKNNKAALLLLGGEWEEGWDLYEYRWILGQTPKHALKLPIPEWNGETLAGRSIIVLDEQGLGDAIQFARYLLILAEREAEVTFCCRGGLHRLFKGLDQPVLLVDRFDPQAHYDYQIALSSLPRAFKTRLGAIPARASYLRAEVPLAQKWAARIGSHGFKIGICWRGNANIKGDPARSIPLACFAPLGEIDGVRLISIQKGSDESLRDDPALFPWCENLGGNFDAGADHFIDAAAAMQSLDLVVTCDTSIAHLAGALGRPVWVVLKHAADWRWLLDREDSPWYPSMRLFRQNRRGDWPEVFSRVAQALQVQVEGARLPDSQPF